MRQLDADQLRSFDSQIGILLRTIVQHIHNGQRHTKQGTESRDPIAVLPAGDDVISYPGHDILTLPTGNSGRFCVGIGDIKRPQRVRSAGQQHTIVVETEPHAQV